MSSHPQGNFVQVNDYEINDYGSMELLMTMMHEEAKSILRCLNDRRVV
jgi:hypothetical protein